MSHTQYTPNLGHLCDGSARRDAVHIAVAPLVAAETLLIGEQVGLLGDGRASADETLISGYIGIVDPFLKDSVQKGQTFWLFLFPGTITALRHTWQHPAFKPRTPENIP